MNAKPSIDLPDADLSAREANAYDAWLREKVLRGLAQAEDRATMIPAEDVWRTLGLEP